MQEVPGLGGTLWHLLVWFAEWGQGLGMCLLLHGQQRSRYSEKEGQLFRLPLTGMRGPSSWEPALEI